MDGTGSQINDEEGVNGDQPIPGKHLRAEEVGGDQGFPVRLEKTVPGSVLAADRCGIKSMAPPNVGDGRITHRAAEIIPDTGDAVAAPVRVFLNQPDDEFFKLPIHGRSADGIGPGKGPLLGDEDTEPAEQGVWSDKACALPKEAAVEEFGFAGKPNSLGVGKALGSAAELFEENAVLCLKVFDNGLLMSVHPRQRQ